MHAPPRRAVRRANAPIRPRVALLGAALATLALTGVALSRVPSAGADQRVAAALAPSARTQAEALRTLAAHAPPAPAPPPPPGRVRLATSVGPVIVDVPPGATATTPRLVVLHGMGSYVTGTCDLLTGLASAAGDARSAAIVLCPAGNVQGEDDVADWTGDGAVKAAHLDRALGEARAALGLADRASRPDTLVGFSRGAFVARDVTYERPGRFGAIVFLGAALLPDAARLRAGGVERVVLSSGDLDGARRTMLAAQPRLERGGVPARFVSLGPHYHTLPEDTAARLGEAVRWATGRS